MRIVLSLLLILHSGPGFASEYRKPAFWNAEWERAYHEFRFAFAEALRLATAGEDFEVEVRNVGDALASLNVLA